MTHPHDLLESESSASDAAAKTAVLSAHGLVKTYTLGEVVVQALRGVDLELRESDCSSC